MNAENWAQTGVIGALLLLILTTGIKRVWIFYYVHREIVDSIVKAYEQRLAAKDDELHRERTDREHWQQLALRQAGILETTVERTTEIVHKVAGLPVADREAP